MSFNDSIHKHKLKNQATSILKIQQDLSSFGWSDIGIYLRDGNFSSNIGIVSLHQSKGTHWVVYINQNFFASYGSSPPQKAI